MSEYPPTGSFKVSNRDDARTAAAYIVAYVGAQFGGDADRVSALAQSLQDWLDQS